MPTPPGVPGHRAGSQPPAFEGSNPGRCSSKASGLTRGSGRTDTTTGFSPRVSTASSSANSPAAPVPPATDGQSRASSRALPGPADRSSNSSKSSSSHTASIRPSPRRLTPEIPARSRYLCIALTTPIWSDRATPPRAGPRRTPRFNLFDKSRRQSSARDPARLDRLRQPLRCRTPARPPSGGCLSVWDSKVNWRNPTRIHPACLACAPPGAAASPGATLGPGTPIRPPSQRSAHPPAATVPGPAGLRSGTHPQPRQRPEPSDSRWRRRPTSRNPPPCGLRPAC